MNDRDQWATVTGETALNLLFLLVSLISLVMQSTSLHRLHIREDAPALLRASMVRTAISRVAAATLYVLLALAGLAAVTAFPIASLAVFTGVQLLWITNGALDVRVWRASVNPPRRARHRRPRYPRPWRRDPNR